MATEETPQTTNVLHIDGATLEGGGQLVRNAIAFSALLARPLSISNIRANRKQKGLKAQHAAGIKLVADICNAETKGVQQNSESVTFIPHTPKPGHYVADPGTAGSTTLLLQIAFPCLLFSPATPSETDSGESHLTLRGGTNAIAAPQIDYTIHVFFPFIRRHFNIDPHIYVKRRGYYPKGGGEVTVIVPHASGPLLALNLTSRGAVTAVRGRAYVAGSLPMRLVNLMVDAAKAQIISSGINKKLIDIEAVKEDESTAIGNGSGIILWAETEEGCIIAGSAIGVRGTNASLIGKEAAEDLVSNLAHGGCVDEYMQDQMIIFMALAKGKSTVATGPLSLHTKTAIWLAEKLTSAKFQTEEKPGTGRTIITCEGIGLESPSHAESN
ncbi:hypothetical protein M422DRAFT_187819 [Sphaerobolus stellatus SS14]|uniref:RNA 3'-terminal phosphate cyclase n=1 Tax=Sphaerobolus stellatus (strain SS14) TaxID=990650 RepID=A0A0C9UM62_SPHS4|nr:hypothetical protein M422DRAFT_187819 [Sphaerobolus stellatus SS14]